MTGKSEQGRTKCVAVIQCEVAHERCSGAQCAAGFAEREDLFAEYGNEVKYYVPFPCGGCPGRRISRLVVNLQKVMKRRSVEQDEIAVHLSSCMASDNAHNRPCPYLDDIKVVLARKGFSVIEGSLVSKTAERRRREGIYQGRGEA